MVEISGKYNRAICYCEELEEQAREQILSVCNQEAFSGSKIRIMPDVHAGKTKGLHDRDDHDGHG